MCLNPLSPVPQEVADPVTDAGNIVHVYFIKQFNWIYGIKSGVYLGYGLVLQYEIKNYTHH